MEFEWDENKRYTNLSKHGIDFVRAANIFSSPILEREDNRYDYDESRFIALGETNGIVLFVVYTMRGSVYRIISARRATKREQRQYYQSIYG
ncbi:MAG: BrnT family toxin [Hydrococcus sp. SU_1_0]|nr:BrnT family toxin [Hydrococcus sp. SU_1_0]